MEHPLSTKGSVERQSRSYRRRYHRPKESITGDQNRDAPEAPETDEECRDSENFLLGGSSSTDLPPLLFCLDNEDVLRKR